MRPVTQTRFSKKDDGNCFEAALASFLDLPLDAVPDFIRLYGYRDTDAMNRATEEFVRSQGWTYQCYKPDPNLPDSAHITWERARELWRPMGWSLVTGTTRPGQPCYYADPGAACEHICVAYDGEIVHDPWPTFCGLAEVCAWWEFKRIDP